MYPFLTTHNPIRVVHQSFGTHLGAHSYFYVDFSAYLK